MWGVLGDQGLGDNFPFVFGGGGTFKVMIEMPYSSLRIFSSSLLPIWQNRLWSFKLGATKSDVENQISDFFESLPSFYILKDISESLLSQHSFFDKSIIHFVSPNLKLHNRYCHTWYTIRTPFVNDNETFFSKLRHGFANKLTILKVKTRRI